MKKNGCKKYTKTLTTKNINMKPKTNEEILDLITAVVNEHCNDDSSTPRSRMKHIQRILEEEYIHGSIYNDAK